LQRLLAPPKEELLLQHDDETFASFFRATMMKLVEIRNRACAGARQQQSLRYT
jgi:hypothetical protein